MDEGEGATPTKTKALRGGDRCTLFLHGSRGSRVEAVWKPCGSTLFVARKPWKPIFIKKKKKVSPFL